MTWQIEIPYRSRDDSLAEVGESVTEAIDGPTERAVARNIVLAAAADGDRTAGDLLDRLEAADSDQRRAVLDRAREAAGLKRSAAIDAEPYRHPRKDLRTCHLPRILRDGAEDARRERGLRADEPVGDPRHAGLR